MCVRERERERDRETEKHHEDINRLATNLLFRALQDDLSFARMDNSTRVSLSLSLCLSLSVYLSLSLSQPLWTGSCTRQNTVLTMYSFVQTIMMEDVQSYPDWAPKADKSDSIKQSLEQNFGCLAIVIVFVATYFLLNSHHIFYVGQFYWTIKRRFLSGSRTHGTAHSELMSVCYSCSAG